MKRFRAAATFVAASALFHSLYAIGAAQELPCNRLGATPSIVLVSGIAEDPERQTGSLLRALQKRGVRAHVEVLYIDEREPERIPRQLDRLKLEGRFALVTLSGHIALALRREELKSPTVFATIVDPLAWGIVDNAGHRAANVTGITYDVSLEWKYLEHLKHAFPAVKRVGLLGDRYFFERPTTREMVAQAPSRFQVTVETFVAQFPEELERAFADPRARQVDAWIVPETPVVFRHEERVLELVRARKVPNIFGHPSLLAKGALMTFGVEFTGMYDELAAMLRMICQGTDPRVIPIVRARHVFLGVSVTNAKAMGLAIEPRILPLATTIH